MLTNLLGKTVEIETPRGPQRAEIALVFLDEAAPQMVVCYLEDGAGVRRGALRSVCLSRVTMVLTEPGPEPLTPQEKGQAREVFAKADFSRAKDIWAVLRGRGVPLPPGLSASQQYTWMWDLRESLRND